MRMVDRKWVCDRLAISWWQSYTMFHARMSKKIPMDEVASLLNSSAVNEMPVEWIPSDLEGPAGLCDKLGVSRRDLCRWMHSRRCRLPHWRINKQTARFSVSHVKEWLEAASR